MKGINESIFLRLVVKRPQAWDKEITCVNKNPPSARTLRPAPVPTSLHTDGSTITIMCSTGNGTPRLRLRLRHRLRHLHRQGIHLGTPAGKRTVYPGMGAHRRDQTAKWDRSDRHRYHIAAEALQLMLG